MHMNEKWTKVQKWMHRGLSGFLSLVMVFSVIQPGLASAAEYVCGKTEHSHGEACYALTKQTQQIKTLSCQAAAEAAYADLQGETADFLVHQHVAECFDGDGNQICPLMEILPHEHTEECYTVSQEPKCGLEETEGHTHGDCRKKLVCTDLSEGHTHGDACYEAQECLLEETEGHTHSDDCRKELTCGKEEIVLHVHTEECYASEEETDTEAKPASEEDLPAAEGEPELICTAPVVLEHVHDDSCFTVTETEVDVKTLICPLQEHVHTDACVEKEAVEEAEEEEKTSFACGKEEHAHTDTCYAAQESAATENPAAEKTLTCGKEEHAHTEACEAKQEVELKVVTLNGIIYTDNTYKTKAEDQTVIAVTGKIPEGASVRAFPVELEAQEGKEILFAYDIEIVLKDGTIFQPSEGETVTVDVQSEVVCGAETEVEVYHAPETGEHEKMTATETDKGISFDTKHFSIYYGLAKSVQPATVAQNVTITEVPSVPAPNVTIKMYNYPMNINANHPENRNNGFFFSQSTYLTEDEENKDYDIQASIDGRYQASGISTYYPEMEDTLEDGNYPTTKAGVSYKPYYDSTYYKKTVNTQTSSLFQREGNYYLYDSKQNAAYWDQAKNEFVLYDHIVRPNYIEYDPENLVRSGNFLPFNKLDASTVTVDENTNAARLKNVQASYADLWFGMTVDFEFYMPKDGMVGGDAMEFDFHGDDDVFVYIGVWNEQTKQYDYKLVLDIGGTHPGRSGTINFQTGAVTDFPAGQKSEDGENRISRSTARTKTEPGGVVDTGDLRTLGTIFNLGNGKSTFEDYTRLSLKFFYMERGGNISYSRLKFNLPTLPQNALTVTKEVEPAGTTFLGEGEYIFSVVKANNDKELYIPAGTTFEVQKSGVKVRDDVVAEDGTFTLKNGETAIFANMLRHGIDDKEYGYIVKEIVDTGDNIPVQKVEYQIGSNGNRMSGKQTQELSAESTNTVIFYNTVNTGTLEIEKKVTKDGKEDLGAFASIFTGDNPETFTFDVQVAGTQLNPITLKNGEKHVINNIIAGSEYVVKETGAAGYTVTYKNEINNEVGTPTGSVNGTIETNKTAKVTAINDFRTSTPTTTITKHVANPDGGEHTYTFNWWEVTSVDDETEPEAANKKTVTIENVEKSTESAQIPLTTVSTLDFVNKDGAYANEGSKVFYYRFVEVPDSTGKSVHDPAVYVVKLTVTNDNGTLSETREIYKNGTLLTGNASKMEFTNILLKDLTIEKKMGKDSENINNSGYLLNVVINSNHFRKGMEIKVKDTDKKVSIANDTTTSVTLTDISIGADKSVTITGVPYDSTYTVTENVAYGYTPSYGYSAEEGTEGKVTGNAPTATVTNTERTGTLGIPVTKKLSNSNGEDHGPYTFSLTQVKDAVGTALDDTVVNTGNDKADLKISVSGDTGIGSGKFDLAFRGAQLKQNGEQTFFYKVAEVAADSDYKVISDDSVYVVEVKVSHDGISETLSAEVVKVHKLNDSNYTGGVEFTNTLQGSMKIVKKLELVEGSDKTKDRTFAFDVVLVSKEYKPGLTYQVVVGGAEVSAKAAAVAEDLTVGRITLENVAITIPANDADQSAEILLEKIPAKSEFKVTERPETAYGYETTYGVSTENLLGRIFSDEHAPATGVIKALDQNEVVVVTVTNKELTAEKAISVFKDIVNPDNNKRTVYFELMECDEQGTPITGGTTRKLQAELKDDATLSFEAIPFRGTDVEDANASGGQKSRTFYYQIVETNADDIYTLDADQSKYIVEVTLSGMANSLKAEITGIRKDGKEIGKDAAVSFANVLLGSFTVRKSVFGSTSENFWFTITTGLSGSYPGKFNDKDMMITFTDGSISVKLGHGDSITVYGLPHGTEVTVQEEQSDNFVARHIIDTFKSIDSNTAKFEVSTAGVDCHFKNYNRADLPQTGRMIWVAGVLAILGAGLLGLGQITKKRNRKRKNGK